MTSDIASPDGSDGLTFEFGHLQLCLPRPTSRRPGRACELTTTASYDSVEAILGWTGATTGMLTLDAVSLIKRSH